jgi:hypothetical protein
MLHGVGRGLCWWCTRTHLRATCEMDQLLDVCLTPLPCVVRAWFAAAQRTHTSSATSISTRERRMATSKLAGARAAGVGRHDVGRAHGHSSSAERSQHVWRVSTAYCLVTPVSRLLSRIPGRRYISLGCRQSCNSVCSRTCHCMPASNAAASRTVVNVQLVLN